MKRAIIAVLATAIITILLATPVLAYWYRAQVAVSENTSTAYDMLPIMWDANNKWMADNGFMKSTALDTRVQTLGGLNKPHMVTENKTLTAVPVPALSQTNLYFVTGESDLPAMDIIVGYSDNSSVGYISVADDNVTLLLSDNFTIEGKGWIDTSDGSSGHLAYKEGAIRVGFSETEAIATIGSGVNLSYTTNDYCAKAAGVTTPAGAKITIDAWFYVDALSGAFEHIIATGDLNVANTYWLLRKDTNEKLQFVIGNVGNTAEACNWISTDSIAATTWYFVTATYDAAATPEAVVYVNGEEWAGADSGDGTNIYSPNTHMTIGAARIAAGYNYYLSGDIDEVRVSNSARSLTDHIAKYSRGIGFPFSVDANTVSLWHFDEGAGNTVDATGTNDLIVTGPTWTTTSPVETAVSIIATGVSSGEHTVKAETRTQSDKWATGDVAHLDGLMTSAIDFGAIHDNVTSLWLSVWCKFDDDFYAGVGGGDQYLFHMTGGGADYMSLKFETTNGNLYWREELGGTIFNFAAPKNSWDAGEWYHILASTSNLTGGVQRLIIDDAITARTDPFATTPVATSFELGHTGTNTGFKGQVSNFIVGIDDLSPDEEIDLYAGTAPGDERNYWYIDEGTGLTVVDYGTDSNDGTGGATTTWQTPTYTGTDKTGRLCDFVLSVDDTIARGGTNAVSLKGISVPNNTNEWRFMENNSMPYADNITIWVGGNKELWFEPNDMIVDIDADTSTLPDRATSVANDGTIHWGSNPSGIGVSIGSMSSSGQPGIGVTAETPARSLLPEIGVTDWYVEPDVGIGGALLTNPFRPFVIILSDTTTLTELQAWRLLGLIFVLLITGITIRAVPRHLAIACVAAGGAIVLMVVLTIFPLYALVFVVLCALGGLVSERSHSL